VTEKEKNQDLDLRDELQQKEFMAKYDREYSYRILKGPVRKIVFVLAVIWALGQMYTAGFGVFPPTIQRSLHVGFGLVLIYLLYPMRASDKSNRVAWYDYIFAALSVIVVGYHLVNFEELLYRAGAYTDTDMYISIIAVILVIEATRRVGGPIIVSVTSLFLIYSIFGPYFPGFLQHGGYSIKRITTYMWISSEAILGIPIMVSSTFIILFLIFAAFLKKSGIGDWLTDLAMALAGHTTGGPAKAAVVASATQGTVSGSSVANTVGTGSVTIPLMKSIGYRNEFAGAVEAAASTGGQLMPPIMGAAAFIMTEFTGLPYITIALAAAIPAVLYFTGIFIMVHLEAKKTGLKGLPREQLPNFWKLLKAKWFLSIPIIGIVYFLASGQTPMKAAFYGIILCVVVSSFSKETRMTIPQILETLEEGARSALPVVVACASAGIIVGVVTLTGLGLKFAHGIVELSRGNIYLTMLFTMIASILLGMGVPTTANYIIQATIAAPALITIGVPVIAAHLFVFYFGIIADITPPVALAAFAGSGIAGSNPLKTGIEASKLAFAAYLVPYIFATSPVLVLVDATLGKVIVAVLTAILGMIAIGGAISGYFFTYAKWWERPVLFMGGLLLAKPGWQSNGIGFVLMLIVLGFQWLRVRRETKRESQKISEGT